MLHRRFSEKEIVQLTVLIGTINAWNRIVVGFRALHPMKAEDQVSAA